MTTLKIATFTGRPGSGKSTIIKNVLEARQDMCIFQGKSVTTRKPRVGDVANEYEHVTNDEFSALEKAGTFLWTAAHSGFRFGTRKRDVEAALCVGHISVMTLVPDAVRALHQFADSERIRSFFVVTPDEKTLTRRMVEVRGAEDRARAEKRIVETLSWAPDMLVLRGIPIVVVENKDEQMPGKAAAELVLQELDR